MGGTSQPTQSASSPSQVETGLPPTCFRQSLALLLRGFCPLLPGSLAWQPPQFSSLQPPTLANTPGVGCPPQKLPHTLSASPSAAASAPGSQSVMTG